MKGAKNTPNQLNSAMIWQCGQLHEALPLLAGSLGASHASQQLPSIPLNANQQMLADWLTHTATQLGMEIRSTRTTYRELKQMLRYNAPLLVTLPDETPGFLLLLRCKGSMLYTLGHDQNIHKLPLQELATLLTAPLARPWLSMTDNMLAPLDVSERRRQQIKQEVLHRQLEDVPVQGCYLLRLLPGDRLWPQLRQTHIPMQMAMFGLATTAALILMLAGWMVIGRDVFLQSGFHGHLDLWILLILTAIPFQLLAVHLKNNLSLDIGHWLRRRVLDGILQLEPDEIRHQGSGSFLVQVMNVEFLEGQGLGTVFSAFTALLQLLLACYILNLGLAKETLPLLLIAFIAVFLFFGFLHYRHMKAWVLHARRMGFDLTENMVGHRTRLAQQHPEHMHDDEDQLLARYARLSERLDHSESLMKNVCGRRGWLLISLAGLFPVFTTPHPDVASLAISIGGILLAALALEQIGQALRYMTGAYIVREQLQNIDHSSQRYLQGITQSPPRFVQSEEIERRDREYPLMELRGVSYTCYERTLLDNCDLYIKAGQRLLLEGNSGGGKSTLAALIAALKLPHQGQICLLGMTVKQWGAQHWRKHVVIAPQFHDNHIINETFAFNVLMGNNWPPTPEDLREAEQICRELRLGNLLDRMPAGMQQMVGESGWRLSHGERSRMFIARSLLQQPRLMILDESFAALDPETLGSVLQCVLRRSNALLVIAHP